MRVHRWFSRDQRDGWIVVELVEQRRGTFVALELFASCCSSAPSYVLVAVGAARTVIGWLRAGEA
jgi:hypothetical protein